MGAAEQMNATRAKSSRILARVFPPPRPGAGGGERASVAAGLLRAFGAAAREFRRAVSLGLLVTALAQCGCGQAPTPTTDPAPAATNRSALSVYPRFSDWKAACDRLPSNRALKLRLPPRELLPLKRFAELREVVDGFFALSKTGALAQASAWLGDPPTKEHFFNTEAAYFLKPIIPFQPFVQRLVVPPGTEAIFHGDFHGDIHSMIAWLGWLNEHGYLQDFKLARPDTYLILLGDYTDRGAYGTEVLYTILRLKLANPERVLLVRGNHEDWSLAARYGFLAEAQAKFGRQFDARRVMRLYDFMPVVLYLGCGTNFIQCNHGGMEPGFDPGRLLDAPEEARFQFLGELKQAQFVKAHPDWAKGLPEEARRVAERALTDFVPEDPTTPSVLGFMWNDFTVASGEVDLAIDPGRAFVYGQEVTRLILAHASTEQRRLHAVFRAHQHANVLTPVMRRLKASRGVYRHWQTNDPPGLLEADPVLLAARLEQSPERAVPPNSVWTFNVSPDSIYGEGCDFAYDTFGILTLAKDAAEWKLRVVNQQVVK
jgi:hypothetical protein